MLIHGDCLEEMRKMGDCSIDCVVCDPPYGLSFMSKKWDNEVPGAEYWKEAYRISKSGSFLLAAGAPRSHHHLAMAIEQAGWEITDCIMWIFGSGFPKGKSQLKPAYEPWILARKKADKCKHLNIDACRIGTQERVNHQNNKSMQKWKEKDGRKIIEVENKPNKSCIGRFPANIIFDEEAAQQLDQMSGFSKSPSGQIRGTKSKGGILNRTEGHRLSNSGHSDSGGASRFFYCAKASSSERNAGLEGLPLKTCAEWPQGGIKSGQKRGCSRSNNHPCVKPIKLMEYLLKLVMPPNPDAICLDPFMGSGTTCLAAKRLGFKCIGIEKEAEYFEIAKKRLEAEKPDPQMEFEI